MFRVNVSLSSCSTSVCASLHTDYLVPTEAKVTKRIKTTVGKAGDMLSWFVWCSFVLWLVRCPFVLWPLIPNKTPTGDRR